MATVTETVHSRRDLYVLLIFDGLYLLVPQDDIESVEIVSDVHTRHSIVDDGVVGWFNRHGHEQDIPIFCVSGDLQLLSEIPEPREYFVLLKTTEHFIGILCDEVESLNIKKLNIQIQPIPAIMHLPTSPISGLAIYQELIAIFCKGVDLTKYLLNLAEHFDHISEFEVE